MEAVMVIVGVLLAVTLPLILIGFLAWDYFKEPEEVEQAQRLTHTGAGAVVAAQELNRRDSVTFNWPEAPDEDDYDCDEASCFETEEDCEDCSDLEDYSGPEDYRDSDRCDSPVISIDYDSRDSSNDYSSSSSYSSSSDYSSSSSSSDYSSSSSSNDYSCGGGDD